MSKTTRPPSELRIPPQDLAAERALLGAMILSGAGSGRGIDEAAEIVQREHFYADVHGIVFGRLQAMRAAGVPVDAVTLGDALQTAGELADVGGLNGLHDLLQAVPYIEHCAYYAKIVRDRWRRRIAMQAGQELQALADDLTVPPDDALAAAESRLHEAIAGGGGSGLSPIKALMVGALDAINNPQTVATLPTGFAALDGMTRGGMRPGNQIILAARPSMGKTALALGIAWNVLKCGGGVLVASYEMTAGELIERLIALVSGVGLDDFRKFKNAVAEAASQIDRTKLYIDDSQPSINQLVAAIRLAARKGVTLVVVDYLQLVPPEDSRAMREQQVASISRKLKQVALSCKITILALSQLNRAVESRDNPRPRLSDLRESGAIEQDADLVWMLWRPSKDSTEKPDDVASVDIAKNRNGRCGVVHLGWHGPTATFANPDECEAAR